MSMKNTFPTLVLESLMVLVMVISCPIDQIMDIWVVSGSGQMVNRGTISIGTLVNQRMKVQMIVS